MRLILCLLKKMYRLNLGKSLIFKEKSSKQNDNELFKLNTKEGHFWINGGNQIQTKQNEKNPNLSAEAGNMEQDPWLVIKSFKANTNKVLTSFGINWLIFRAINLTKVM